MTQPSLLKVVAAPPGAWGGMLSERPYKRYKFAWLVNAACLHGPILAQDVDFSRCGDGLFYLFVPDATSQVFDDECAARMMWGMLS